MLKGFILNVRILLASLENNNKGGSPVDYMMIGLVCSFSGIALMRNMPKNNNSIFKVKVLNERMLNLNQI